MNPQVMAAQDLVVIGGGISGLTAANRAVELGLKVTVLEQGKDEIYPCNARYSGGILHAALHDITRPVDDLYGIIQTATQGTSSQPLAQAVATDGRRLLKWLQDHGVRFMRFNQQEAYKWCMAPPRALVAGLDWKGRGPDVMMRSLTRHFAEKGGALILGARARSLQMDGDRCVGVLGGLDGVERLWPARAVLIADGGFQSNFELFRKHIGPKPESVLQRGAGNGRGDGMLMATAVGAATIGLNRFYGHLLCRDALTDERVWPYPELDGVATAAIVVGSDGRRWVDEGLGGVSITNYMTQLDDPTSTVLICDAAIWDGPGKTARIPANPLLEKAGGTVLRANTLAELAARLGMPEQALADTVKSYNEAVKAGRLDTLDPPRSTDKFKAWPIDTAPFVAIRMCAGITNTTGGIVIDGHGCVLKPDGAAIPGLYAAGTSIGGLEGHGTGRVGYIGGLIKAVFGLRAAEHVAESMKGA